MVDKIYVDEDTVVSFFCGEIGWFLQRWASRLRFLKQQVYKDKTFILFTHTQLHPLVDDFVGYTISLPKEFYDLQLESDCYEAPYPNAPSGTLTSPNVYSALIKYMRNFYNVEKAIEIWPPRGCNFSVDRQPQVFRRYTAPKIETKKPIVCVFPRGRARAPQRNVPEHIWKETVDKLREDFIVVLGGTPSGSVLANYNGENIINLINYNGDDKLALIIQYLCNSVCSISSQSGLTHLSLLTACPTYIIGHEKERHSITENRLSAVCSFRYVTDYRAIDSQTILTDVAEFLNFVERSTPKEKVNKVDINRSEEELNDPIGRPSLRTLRGKKDLVGVEIGVDRGGNAESILKNLDIKTLYLIDPYYFYNEMRNLGCHTSEEQNIECETEAKKRLLPYEDKIVWIRDTSENAIDKIPDDVDFVYIDGNHRYEYVKKDIELYSKKVKNGGLIAGHDYDYIDTKKAVDECIHGGFVRRANGGPSNHIFLDWWTIKESEEYDEIVDRDKEILNNIIGERKNG